MEVSSACNKLLFLEAVLHFPAEDNNPQARRCGKSYVAKAAPAALHFPVSPAIPENPALPVPYSDPSKPSQTSSVLFNCSDFSSDCLLHGCKIDSLLLYNFLGIFCQPQQT